MAPTTTVTPVGSVAETVTDIARPAARSARGNWIDHWEPEDPTFWASVGRRIAGRNLFFSILAEHIGFSIWLLWSIVVVKMLANADGTVGASGWALTTGQGLWLTAVPSGVGALLRLPYTFAVPKFGGRNWTVVSALLLVIPCLGLAWVVNHPEVPFGVLLLIAGTAGFGGGNFASSMANISFFYPEKEKGWALGLNAAGGNVGVAVVQKVVPLVVIAGGGLALSRAGLMYIPLAVAAAALAYLFMDNLTEAKADFSGTARSTHHTDTWIMAFLYIGTFGSFIGYSAAFPTLLKAVFDRPDIALTWGFLGAAIGSVSRPLGGRLADRMGGAVITVVSFGLMIAAGISGVIAVQHKSLLLFFVSFMVLFVATGIGNGSAYRMIPAIFRAKALDAGGTPEVTTDFKRQAAGAVGIISAVGAFGGFLVPIIYAWSKASSGTIIPALQAYVVLFAVMAAVTWFFYLRPGARMTKIGV